MSLLSQAPIAIIGAGPSGLTLARLLELATIDYIVFERDESATCADEYSSSGTLDIHKDSGQLALKEAGLIEKFQSIARYDVPTRIVDAQGRVHANLSGDGAQDKPEIDRKDLRRLLLGSIPTGRIHWGYKIQRVQKDNDGSVSVYSANGHCESGFRLVVGADGAWSKVRKLVSTTPLFPMLGKTSDIKA
jgi:2-polyprenyl-6-methoxyphenol hydroxylase-like FAD-dependent oxidoreductase